MRIAKIDTTLRNYFHHWINFTLPFHGLGKTEKKVLAEFLYYRYLLKQEVQTQKLLETLLFDPDTKAKICEQIGIPKSRIHLIISQFRKDGVVVGKDINPRFIPDLKVKDKEFVLAFKFNITGNEEGVYSKKSRKKTSKDSGKGEDTV